MKIKDVHPDMERYLYEDCYCPYEVYSFDGMFYELFEPGYECKLVAESDHKVAVVSACKSFDTQSQKNVDDKPEILLFWKNEDKVTDALRMDATDNNLELVKLYVHDEDMQGRKFNFYNKDSVVRSLKQVFDLCDGIVVS